eukprot:765974-Hanusia_phi.AAC.5
MSENEPSPSRGMFAGCAFSGVAELERRSRESSSGVRGRRGVSDCVEPKRQHHERGDAPSAPVVADVRDKTRRGVHPVVLRLDGRQYVLNGLVEVPVLVRAAVVVAIKRVCCVLHRQSAEDPGALQRHLRSA